MTIDEEVGRLLDQVDREDSRISEFEISERILEIVQAHGQAFNQQSPRVIAAHVALRFLHEGPQENEYGDTHFHPFAVTRRPDGTALAYPSPHLLSGPVAVALEELARGARNAALRARYWDVLWDMSRSFTQQPRKGEWATSAIDAYLAACEGRVWKDLTELCHGLIRAGELAITIRDTARAVRVKREALALGEQSGPDSLRLRLMGFNLLWGSRERLELNAEEEARIVRALEEEFSQLTAPPGGDQQNLNGLEACTISLARYYLARDARSDLERVLRAYLKVIEQLTAREEPLVAYMRLSEVHGLLQQFGMTAERDSVARQIEGVRKTARASAKSIESKLEIPAEQFEEAMRELTQGSLDDCLQRLVVVTIPSQSGAQRALFDALRQAPLVSLIPVQLFDKDGHPVARLDSVLEDPEGRIVHHCGRAISIRSVFVRLAIERLIEEKKLDSARLQAWFAESPVIADSRRAILAWGLDRYFEADWIGATHGLITLTEGAARELVRLSGGVIYRQARGGGLVPCELDALLRDSSVNRVFGKDAALYLRTLLTDRRGLNLRNSVCHGALPAEGFNAQTATQALIGLLLLSAARVAPPKSDQASA